MTEAPAHRLQSHSSVSWSWKNKKPFTCTRAHPTRTSWPYPDPCSMISSQQAAPVRLHVWSWIYSFVGLNSKKTVKVWLYVQHVSMFVHVHVCVSVLVCTSAHFCWWESLMMSVKEHHPASQSHNSVFSELKDPLTLYLLLLFNIIWCEAVISGLLSWHFRPVSLEFLSQQNTFSCKQMLQTIASHVQVLTLMTCFNGSINIWWRLLFYYICLFFHRYLLTLDCFSGIRIYFLLVLRGCYKKKSSSVSCFKCLS